jgi:hypothetical protein
MATQRILQAMVVDALRDLGDERVVLDEEGKIVAPPWLRADAQLEALLAAERAMTIDALKLIRES